jgi:hypothetical protein
LQDRGVLCDTEPLSGVKEVVAMVGLHKACKSMLADNPHGHTDGVLTQYGQSCFHLFISRLSIMQPAVFGPLSIDAKVFHITGGSSRQYWFPHLDIPINKL